ncbi:Uu.00g051610.m01.CDS01 [Anthostomella pinea]|uniref:Uu.00g051610.m01.CDS01 n=1 Tax=Anthostomella pinea TaxID=933095 RepID=A0AAI8VQE7_9PEZI|nr:Uu.00g051610.m01.CDS01 [Anthostomella pinea]
MSQERPEPPLGADSPEELIAHVTNNPSNWLLYLRHINGYAAALKEKNDFFRLAESDHDNSLQPATEFLTSSITQKCLAYLENAFRDPDRIQNAQNKLYQLKQRNQDFSIFFSEFQCLALEGEMPEDALTPLLFQGISRELQDMLLHSPTPSRRYRDYANHLQALDNRFRQYQQQVSRNRVVTSAKTPASYAAAVVPRQPAATSPNQPKRE